MTRCFPPGAKNNRVRNLTPEDARTNDVVHADLSSAVENANKAVSKPESIRKFSVLAGDFTQDNGYLTPSLKVKRAMVMRDFAPDIEALYAGPGQ